MIDEGQTSDCHAFWVQGKRLHVLQGLAVNSYWFNFNIIETAHFRQGDSRD
jgi:hypothetical protein